MKKHVIIYTSKIGRGALLIYKKGVNKEVKMVNLGDEVKDMATGFKGIALSRHSYLQGCDRITVQPKIDKEGKLPEEKTFDEPQLEVIKKKVAKRQIGNPGGPAAYLPKAKGTGYGQI